MADVTLVLQARNEDTLAETTTAADGHATFAPGLLRGSGGREAVLLKAHSAEGGYTFLSLNGAAFDLASHSRQGGSSMRMAGRSRRGGGGGSGGASAILAVSRAVPVGDSLSP